MDNITENNKLIAEFLVNNEGNLVKIRDGVYSTIDENEVPDDDLTINDLKYHEDWNWLMRVIEKILQVCAEMDEMERYWRMTDAMPYIDNVYNTCVEFVKFYNK